MCNDEPLTCQPSCNRGEIIDGAHAGIIQRFHTETPIPFHSSGTLLSGGKDLRDHRLNCLAAAYSCQTRAVDCQSFRPLLGRNTRIHRDGRPIRLIVRSALFYVEMIVRITARLDIRALPHNYAFIVMPIFARVSLCCPEGDVYLGCNSIIEAPAGVHDGSRS
jgi:hypothetical protein